MITKINGTRIELYDSDGKIYQSVPFASHNRIQKWKEDHIEFKSATFPETVTYLTKRKGLYKIYVGHRRYDYYDLIYEASRFDAIARYISSYVKDIQLDPESES